MEIFLFCKTKISPDWWLKIGRILPKNATNILQIGKQFCANTFQLAKVKLLTNTNSSAIFLLQVYRPIKVEKMLLQAQKLLYQKADEHSAPYDLDVNNCHLEQAHIVAQFWQNT